MSEPIASVDTAAREAAIDPRRSILLQAPAGSGKTAVLTQRYLRLLTEVEEPGAILAITFTRKAAAEMRARVMRALRGEIHEHDPCAPQLRRLAARALAHAAARGWRLLENPAALRIQTIDAFNYWLASQLPLAAQAGGALNLAENAADLYRRAARRALSAADADASLSADADLLFERFDNQWGRLERALAEMLKERGHWLRYVLQEDPARLCERVNESLADLIASELGAVREPLEGVLLTRLESLAGVGRLGGEASDLPAWQRLASLALTDSGWRSRFDPRHLAPVDPAYQERAARERLRQGVALLAGVPGLEARLRTLRELPPPALSAADTAAVAALSRLLKQAAAQLHLEFATAAEVDYTYVTGAAREALAAAGEPTDLALRTGLALSHILVDEFQDTSLAQFELLERLTAGWDAGDGRTLFVVGDPMQSIYRFRDAEVGLFIAAREHGIGTVPLEPFKLTRNFRSTAPLVAWINEVFAAVLGVHDDLAAGAVAFGPSVSAAAPGSPAVAGAVSLRLFPGERLVEAGAVAAEIARLRAADPGASIAVLVAAHAHATPIVNALAARGVECLGVDLVPLAERAVVRDLVQLARALADLGDRAAWLAVLRAPWCGAQLSTLSALSRLEDPQLIWEALADPARLSHAAAADLPRLARLRAVLTPALARGADAGAADTLEALWLQLGAADAYAPQELEDARAFFNALAARAASSTWRSAEDFPALLHDLFSAAGTVSDNAVQVMTIHRAKGLEFDHVFVPALDRAADSSRTRLLEWIDLPRAAGGSDLLLAAAPTAAGKSPAPTLNGLIRSLTSVRARHERARLVYVAATRARRSLQLSAAPALGRDGKPRIAKGSPLECLWAPLEGAFECVPQAQGVPAIPAALPLRRLTASWQAPQLSPAAALARLPLPRSPLVPDEFSWVGETQRHVGTIVHAWLARTAASAVLPTRADIASERALLAGELRRAGVAPAERAAALELIVAALERTIADPRGRWILSAHRAAASELPLTGLAAGQLRSVVIDRAFVDDTGTRWVIDYKTSRHEGGALEEFLAQELERYREQLETYAALAQRLGPEPVRAALYFPLLGELRELTASR